ncbi:MAG TPA: hypothetical protein DDZ88_25075 [Verrucomicrobiales bacterium]|nr:hypothetical protein [Verrucomicrobiales bacterium]
MLQKREEGEKNGPEEALEAVQRPPRPKNRLPNAPNPHPFQNRIKIGTANAALLPALINPFVDGIDPGRSKVALGISHVNPFIDGIILGRPKVAIGAHSGDPFLPGINIHRQKPSPNSTHINPFFRGIWLKGAQNGLFSGWNALRTRAHTLAAEDDRVDVPDVAPFPAVDIQVDFFFVG